MINKNIFIILLCIIFRTGFSQISSNARIFGLVSDEKNDSIEFATVSLFKLPDSSFVGGTLTDEAGRFEINQLKQGEYFVQLYLIGYEPKNIPSFNLINDTVTKNLGVLFLSVSQNSLTEIEITGEKNIYETKIDKRIYNVDKDLMSVTGSASDVLDNVPSVSVDIDGNVTLRGSGDLTILVNGKLSPMMKVNSAAALQAIPAHMIERIEIITNPSAKYKVTGASGIINIVLKKNSKQGLNGNAGANFSDDDRYNGSISLNYKPGKLNYFLTYSFRQDNRYRLFTDDRVTSDSVFRTYNQSSYANYRPQSHSIYGGVDYEVDSANSFGISLNYFTQGFSKSETNSIKIYDINNNEVSNYNRDLNGKEYEDEKELTATYEHKFKKEDHTLSCEVNLADHYEEEDNKFTETIRLPTDSVSLDNRFISQVERSADFVVEYVYPVNEDDEFEAGYNWESFGQTFEYLGKYFDATSNTFKTDELKSNKFRFLQNVHALYSTYTKGIEDLSILGGLRFEQTFITSHLLTNDSIIPYNYFRVYPTVHLSYEIGDRSELGLSYSKRIMRPEGDELNPFPDYTNPRNLSAGNPKLKPEQTHSIELSYLYKNRKTVFAPTLYYRYMYDGFTEISSYINDSTLYTTFENVSNEKSAGIELVLSTRFKKIGINLTSNGFYNQLNASNLGYSSKKSIFASVTKLNVNFNITKSTALQVTSTYRSSQLTPQGKYLPVFLLNAGIKQELFKKKATLILTVSDVFNTLRSGAEINTADLTQKTYYKRKSQIVYFGFSYRFGNNARRNDEIKYDEKVQ